MNNPFMGNPQVFLQQMMNSPQVRNNPMAKNTIDLIQKRDSKGLENLARNLCAEKGINPDDALRQVKSQFGIK